MAPHRTWLSVRLLDPGGSIRTGNLELIGSTAAAMAHESAVSFSSGGGTPEPDRPPRSVSGTVGQLWDTWRPPTTRAIKMTKEPTLDTWSGNLHLHHAHSHAGFVALGS